MSIKHAKVSAIPDGTDGTLVRPSDWNAEHIVTGIVLETLFNAHTILTAVSDNTPVALSVAEQRLLGRITGGDIAALTATQIRTLLNIEDGATADLTGVEIVALLEALATSSRLSHTKLDDVGASDHHTKYTNAEAVVAGAAQSLMFALCS